MAGKNRYQDNSSPIKTILYILAVLILLAALAFMYKTYRDKRKDYSRLVEEASVNEMGYDIESRKERAPVESEAAPESTVTATPTEAPTATPTEAPTPEPTEAPTPEPTEAPAMEPTATPYLPDAATNG